MIIGIVTFRANRQKKLLRRFADAAHPEVRAAQRVGRFPILRLEPLRCPPMFDGCFGLPVFTDAPTDCVRASTGVKSRMKSVAAALLHLLQLLRPGLLIIRAAALPG